MNSPVKVLLLRSNHTVQIHDKYNIRTYLKKYSLYQATTLHHSLKFVNKTNSVGIWPVKVSLESSKSTGKWDGAY
jgi:hypothetical protein